MPFVKPGPTERNDHPRRLTISAPGKDIVLETIPGDSNCLRIDGILVSTEILPYVFRPNPDPRVWLRYERTQSPTHPSEDVITVHTEVREDSPWIKVTDRLPEPGTDVIVHNGFLGVATYQHPHHSEMWWDAVAGGPWSLVTHWMPTPEGPR